MMGEETLQNSMHELSIHHIKFGERCGKNSMLGMIPTHNRFCTYAQTANTGTCRLGVIVGESPMDTKVDKPLRGFWVGSKAGATGIWTSVAITEQGKICDNNDIVSLLSSPSVFSITAPGLRDLHGNVGRFHAIETRLSQLACARIFSMVDPLR